MNPNNNWNTPGLNQNKFMSVNPNQNKNFNYSGNEILPRNSSELNAFNPNLSFCSPQPNFNNMKVNNNSMNNSMFNKQSNMSFMNNNKPMPMQNMNMSNMGNMSNMNNNDKNIKGNYQNDYGNNYTANKVNNMIMNNNQNKIIPNQNNFMNNPGIVQINVNGNINDMNTINKMSLMNNMKNNVNVVVNNNINIMINNVGDNPNNNMNNKMNIPNNMNMMNNMKMNIPNNNMSMMNNKIVKPNNNMNMMNNMNMAINMNMANNMNNNVNAMNNNNQMNNNNMPNNMNPMNNNMNNNNIAMNNNMNPINNNNAMNNNNVMNNNMNQMNANMGINNNGNNLNYNMNNQRNQMFQSVNVPQNMNMNNSMAMSVNVNMNDKMKNMQNNMNMNINNIQNNNGMNNNPNNMNNQNNMNVPNNMNMQQNIGINNGNMQMSGGQMNNNLMGNQNNTFNNNMNNNMGFQFMNNLRDFKLDLSRFKTFKEKPVNYNDIILNKKAEAFATELDNIKNKLDAIFCQDELAKIMDEKTLLKFFREKEEELIKYVDDYFGGEEFLKKFTIDEIKHVFNENPIINHISQLVIAKINDIKLNEMTSEKQLKNVLKDIFKVKLPNFLKERPMNDLKAILFYQNRKEETTTIINNINKKNNTNSSKLLNFQLEKIRQNQGFILQGIKYKLQLIYIYILVNSLSLKTKFWHKFLNFLSVNEMLIKYYFDQQFNHSQLFQEVLNMSEENINQKIENFFLVFETNLNNIENDIYNIIASFYYIIIYQCKGSPIPNIGNTYLNLTLKNFVIFLDKKFKGKINFGDNLYELLKELYISDMNFLVNNKYYPERNYLYDFQYIDSILINNDKVKEAYEELKKNYSSEKENEGFFTKVKNQLRLGEGRDFSTFERYIKLIPCDEFVFTNTITIIIDGFTTEESNPMEKWKDFINHFKKESMFYFYKWPSDSVDNILSRGILNALRFGSKNFSSATERAKICGKILAYIIYSNAILKNYQINLVGFSLGNHVIKYCLKEINRLNEIEKQKQNQYFMQDMNNNDPTFNEVYLKNVILVAAATTIKHKESMIKYESEVITNKLINCYSKVDKVLEHLYYRCMIKEAVGRNELNLFNNNKNPVDNYDFTPYNYGHLTYNMGVVAKVFSGDYKEI